jgi:hypothetical protein
MLYVKVDKNKFPGKDTDTLIVDESVKSLPDGIEIDYDKYVEFFLHKKLEDVMEAFGKQDQLPPKPVKKIRIPKPKSEGKSAKDRIIKSKPEKSLITMSAPVPTPVQSVVRPRDIDDSPIIKPLSEPVTTFKTELTKTKKRVLDYSDL